MTPWGRISAIVVLTIALGASAAHAAVTNDDRQSARTIGAGADVTGTTVGATREAGDPPNCPERGQATVWYRYVAPKDGVARLLLQVIGGKLDASVAVYEVENAVLTRVACADTRRGRVFTQVSLDKGEYLIRVAERPDSGSGAFRLRFSGVLAEPDPPGRPLGADGRASGTLDPLTRPFAAFSRRLRAGNDYRVRVLAGDPGNCDVSVRLIAPSGETRRTLACRDYVLLTPSPSSAGRWTISLAAGSGTTESARYTVSVTRAGPDDLAPGRFLGAFGSAGDSVSGRGPDAEDVYRFDVTRRAEITLRLRSRGAMRLLLLTERGRRVTSAYVNGDTGQIRTRLRPGRFYAVVSASRSAGGRYRLSRLTRVITSTTVTWDGAGTREKGPGGSSTVGVNVSGADSGRASVVLERFDPQHGWRFWKQRSVGISGGRAAFSVSTATIGRYRARARFLGTRSASPSRARRAAHLRVVAPLRD